MRAAQLDSDNIVINYAEVEEFFGPFIDPLDSVLGAHWNGTSFENPPPPEPPTYPPDTPEQAFLEFAAMINRRADALEAKGDLVGALLLREFVK